MLYGPEEFWIHNFSFVIILLRGSRDSEHENSFNIHLCQLNCLAQKQYQVTIFSAIEETSQRFSEGNLDVSMKWIDRYASPTSLLMLCSTQIVILVIGNYHNDTSSHSASANGWHFCTLRVMRHSRFTKRTLRRQTEVGFSQSRN